METKFPVKIRDNHKIETNKKKNSIGISVFGYENKEKYLLYASKNTFKKQVGLLIEQKYKQHYVLITDYNTFRYDHRRKHFYRRCSQTFSTEEIY